MRHALTSALVLAVAIAAAPRHAAAYSAITLHTGGSGEQIAFFGDDLLVGVPSTGIVRQIDVQTGTVVRTFSDPAPAVGNFFGSAVQAVGGNCCRSPRRSARSSRRRTAAAGARPTRRRR